MAINVESAEGQIIRKLIPLATLSSIHFEALCTEIFIEKAEKGAVLFRKGDSANDLVYLLEGEINLQAEGLKVETITAGSTASQFAIAHQMPRQIDAVATTQVKYLNIKSELLEKPPVVYVEQENNYVVTEDKEEQSDDWMAMLLRSPIFRHLTPQSLQKVLLAQEEITFGKDKTIIEQNQPGEYFYLVKKGFCQIYRKPNPKSKEIKLSQLRSTDTFGEDALISEEPNHFSVRCLTECSLFRLNKEQFLNLIKEPSLKKIDYSSLKQKQDKNAQIIDVRLPDEYKQKHLEGSINMPYFSLRMQMKNLDRERQVVVVCDDGKLSEAASFLLFKYNFEPFILENGINGIEHDISKPTAQFQIFDGIGVMLDHNDTPPENDQETETPAAEASLLNLSFQDNDAETSQKADPVENKASQNISEFSLDIAQIEAYENNLAEKVEQLTAENKRLKITAQKLHLQCKKLLEDKSRLEKQLIEVVKQKKELEQKQSVNHD